MANNVKSNLESLKSQYRILISEIDDCADSGHFIKRRELLERVSVLRKEIRAIEMPISETDLEQPDKTDRVEIEIQNSQISLKEKNTKELTEDIKLYEYLQTIDIAQKRDGEGEYTKELTEESTHQISDDKDGLNKDNKINSILQEIAEKKRLINLTKAMSGIDPSQGGISPKKANKTIQLFQKDISNLEKELRKLESVPEKTYIIPPYEPIEKQPKGNGIVISSEIPTVPIEASNRSGYNVFTILFIIIIMSSAIFVAINSRNPLDTSNRTIPVIIPVNDIQQNPGSPIAGTWKFENTQRIVSTIIFDENDNAILDGKPYKYSIVGTNLIIKDDKSGSAVPYKLDGNNLLLKLRGSNYDNYVKVTE